MVEHQYLNHVIDMLSIPNNFIKLNTVQLIANLAEHPKGREKFLTIIPKLTELRDDPEFAEYKEYVKKTIDVIEWKP